MIRVKHHNINSDPTRECPVECPNVIKATCVRLPGQQLLYQHSLPWLPTKTQCLPKSGNKAEAQPGKCLPGSKDPTPAQHKPSFFSH